VQSQKTPAIVLRSRDYGEADRIVTFLIPTGGRLTALAKGARKSKRRFLNSLEPFSLVTLFYTEKPHRDLGRIDSCELVRAYPRLRQDLFSLAAAACLTELAGEVVGIQENVQAVFDVLEYVLSLLDQGLPADSLLCSFLIRLLALTGYGPQWKTCQGCRAAPHGSVRFSVKEGGILCERCAPQNSGRLYPLSLGTWKLLQLAQTLPYEKLSRLRFSLLARNQTLSLLQGFYRHLLGRELKSFTFLEKVLS
jgi:DNA repair protein RecO (recombination protein O)